jgi:hypothetical protein
MSSRSDRVPLPDEGGTRAPASRHPLLPDLERSGAVLVACDDDAVRAPESQPSARAARLAEALVSPATGMAFHPARVAVVASWRRTEVLDAVRSVAADASDVLLFLYVGSGRRHEGFALAGPNPGVRSQAPLREVADVVRNSPAARRVVVLDCEHLATASGYFVRDATPDAAWMTSLLGKEPTMYFGSGDDRVPAGDELTRTLAEALWSGVADGPPLLRPSTLRSAVEARWAQLRYYVENEYIGAPDTLTLVGGDDVALGVNVAHGNPGTGGFPRDPAAAHEAESWDQAAITASATDGQPAEDG